MEPGHPALGAGSLNHWSTREVTTTNFRVLILFQKILIGMTISVISITSSVDMSLRKLPEIVKDREAWHVAVLEVTKSCMWLSN